MFNTQYDIQKTESGQSWEQYYRTGSGKIVGYLNSNGYSEKTVMIKVKGVWEEHVITSDHPWGPQWEIKEIAY